LDNVYLMAVLALDLNGTLDEQALEEQLMA
jgi:hypothetical protein